MKSKSMIKTASAITFITLVSKLFGFIRELLIAYFFGTSAEVDMYIMAVNIPTIMLGFISCIGTAYTPVYTEIVTKEGRDKGLGFTVVLLLAIAVICGGVIAVCFVNAPALVEFAAPGFEGGMALKTAEYLKISLWSLLFTTIMNIFICYLNCSSKFVQASFCMLFHSGIQIVFTVFAYLFGPVFLPIGYVAANACYLAAVLAASLKNGFRFGRFFYESRYMKTLLKLVVPIAVSSLVTQVNGYIDKYYASGLPSGSISALHYSNTIRTFVVMMLNTGLVTIFYPVMSKLAAEKEISGMKKVLKASISYILLSFIPITVLLMKFSRILTEFLFQRGAFDQGAAQMTAAAIKMYAVGIAAVALRDVLFNYYYSIKRTTLTLAVSILTIAVNALLDACFVWRFGIEGLALATSLSAVFACPILFLCLKKDMDIRQEQKYLGGILWKCLLSGIIPLVVLLLLEQCPEQDSLPAAIFEAVLYMLLYILMLKLLRVREVDAVLAELKAKIVKH